MNYELAKQLKDAGFQNGLGCGHCGYDGTEDLPPTLSELIEACGDRFQYVRRNNDGTFWAMDSFGNQTSDEQTPEEAVAKLWIELNKRNESTTAN